jgi:hypothetical protein
MGIVIRVVYNNQSWQSPCKEPYSDAPWRQCLKEGNLKIKRRESNEKSDEMCTSNCWEQHICTEYRWGCNAPGKVFGKRAYSGQTVFFVFKQSDNKYTLWGKTSVGSVDDKPVEAGQDDEPGYAFLHFDAFIPLPREKWINNLSDTQLVGKPWLMGTYRFIDNERETYLQNLIDGLATTEPAERKDIIKPADNRTLYHLGLAPNIYGQLDAIANDEGRSRDELIREAIAEWLKSRKR